MSDRFDAADYLRSFLEPEARARAILEFGFQGRPDLEEAERTASDSDGRMHQRILAALGKRSRSQSQRKLQVLNRLRLSRPETYGPPSIGTAAPAISQAKDSAALNSVEHEPEECGAQSPPTNTILTQPRTPDGFAKSIGNFLYENQKKLWSHIKADVISKPIGDDIKRSDLSPTNPFRISRRRRCSDLAASDAVKLYDAVAFAMRQYGTVMNVHIVILWETLGVHDHYQAARLLSEYLNRCKKWAISNHSANSRVARRLKSTRESFVFRYVWVHECAPVRGFHTHILGHVPQSSISDFKSWSRQAIGSVTGHPGDGRSVFIVAPRSRDEVAAVHRCWSWVRYVLKQLDARTGWSAPHETPRLLRDVLKVWPRRASLPVKCAQLIGGSRDIWANAQAKSEFVSQLRSGDLNQLYSGRELEEWRSNLKGERMHQWLREG